MTIIQRPKPFDPSAEEWTKRKVLYGLPEDVKFCKRCVISNQRPNSSVEFEAGSNTLKTTIHFDQDGVCDACRARDVKDSIDWKIRDQELRELCDRHRRTDGRYDCIVPGSGGKDSFYAAWMLKYEYGMHPLTVTWAPHIYTDWGWRNFQRWIHAGFDNQLVTPNARIHRLVTRLSVDVLFHPFHAFILGQKNLGPKMSVLYDVPLVFYGENEAEYGNPTAGNNSAIRDYGYFASGDRSKVKLGGVSLEEYNENYGVEDIELASYLPVDPTDMERAGTEVHYLGYYLKWHPQSCYYHAVENGGFEPSPERTPGTYSKYNSIDDRIDDFHYYTTFIKFGIGRASYDAAQEIRSGDIDRDEAIALVQRYDGEFPERFAGEIFSYLSIPENQFPVAAKMFEQPVMDRAYFNDLVDQFRSPHIWQYQGNDWARRKTVWSDSPD